MGISDVLKALSAAFNLGQVPLPPLPPPLVLAGGAIRPGLSVRKIAARIISRQGEAGAPVGALPDGSQSVAEAMEIIRVEEIINALLTEAKIDVVVSPGISFTAIGIGNSGLPVISQGTTSIPGLGNGIIR